MSGIETGYQGQQDPGDGGGHLNAMAFLVKQALARVNTVTLVKVVAVKNAGGVEPVGFVDVQPLVNQIDGAGNAADHGILHGLPYFRLQGGANAIIIDPQVGDIGVAAFCDRDISGVKASRGKANPGSWARHSMSNGLYFGGMLNATPNQYVAFVDGGINIHSPGTITISAANISSSGSWAHSGSITANGKVIDNTHRHTGVQPGAASTGTVA